MANAQAAAMKKKRKLFSIANGFDMPFLIILMLILVIGLVCMYSASYAYAFYWYDGDSYYFIKRQLAFAVLGVVAMLMISTIDYHVLHKFSWVLWIVSLALLVVAYIMPSSTGIHRWIRIPGIGQFQPSEVAKFALIVLYAHLVSLNHKKMKTFTKGYLPFMAILGITCGLVFIEPHLSGTMLLLGIVLVYLVMVAQFQSLRSPLIVMFTIPLAFTGGFLALLLAGVEVSVISLIGFVMLVGVIVNNGIVLVDYINQLRLEGMGRREAIIEAGVTRLRPILMTSLTTILGLIVMAFGNNVGTALMQPVALVCIGGLLYATLMTLLVVPCMYDILSRRDLRKVDEEELQLLDM